MKSLAIVPVRTGSKRLPNKNTLDFFGKPMFVHTAVAAFESELFDEIHISTESEAVARIAEEYGFAPSFLRPEELATDSAGLDAVCEHTLDHFETVQRSFDNFCLLWATSPLRDSKDIVAAFSLLDQGTDAVVSVTGFDLPVFCAQTVNDDGFLTPIFPDLMWLPSQEMPTAVCDDGSIAWVRTAAFRREGVWIRIRTRPYIMDKRKSVDIDTAEDLLRAQFYYSQSECD